MADEREPKAGLSTAASLLTRLLRQCPVMATGVLENSQSISVIGPQGEAWILGSEVHLVEVCQEFSQVNRLWRAGASLRHSSIVAGDRALFQSGKARRVAFWTPPR